MVIANEKQKDAVFTYRKNHPHTKMIRGDIVTIGDKEVIPAIKEEVRQNGEIQLIAAGPPCQGFSLAGRRNLKDKSKRLFKELVDIVGEIQPKFFLMENIKGLLSMNKGKVVFLWKRQTFDLIFFIVRIFYCEFALISSDKHGRNGIYS